MGREVRRVPLDWKHPTNKDQQEKHGQFDPNAFTHPDSPHPLHDQPYQLACVKWKYGFREWEQGERSKFYAENYPEGEYWDYCGMPPDRKFYRDREWSKEEATAFQLYETVTEGTPVSPVFATAEELEQWLVTNEGMTPEGAHYLISSGSTYSGIVDPGKGITAIGLDVAEYLARNPDK